MVERPPDWQKILESHPEEVLRMALQPAVQEAVSKANERYDYWDKFRTQPLLKSVDREQAWAYLRYVRSLQPQTIPLEDFWFWQPTSVLKALRKIDSVAVCEDDKFAIKSLMEEAITSSQIEGAATTIRDAKEMLLSDRRPKDESEQMIRNNYLTMQLIKKNHKEPFSEELLFSLHQSITENTLDAVGRYRLQEENVHVADAYGNVIFTPPPAEELPKRIDELSRFVNEENEMHPVIKAIILHFWIGYLHPFVDGNGRCARALFYWYLLRHGYDLFEYLSISRVILEKPAQYGRAYLHTELDGSDLTYFIHFNLRVIVEAIARLQERVEKEEEKTAHAMAHPDLNMRQTRLLMHASNHPNEVYTIKKHQKANGLAYQTARTDLLGLVEKGYFKQVQKGKTLYFRA